MAAAGIMISQPTFADSSQWILKELSKTRDTRSTSKAERILGVSSSNGVLAQENDRRKPKKKGSNMSFSFSDLRDVLPGLHKKAHGPYLHPKISDSDSTTSTPSPTFDATASTSTLPSTYSSPVTPKLGMQISSTYFQESNPSESQLSVDPLRINKHENRSEVYARNNFDHNSSTLGPSSHSWSSNASQNERASPLLWRKLTPLGPHHETESIVKGRWTGRKPTLLPSREISFQPKEPLRRPSKPVVEKAERHVQEWLEHADFNRSPSTSSQSLPQPHSLSVCGTFSPTSSITSLRTLTSQSESRDVDSPRSQWPLPLNGFSTAERTGRNTTKRRKLHRTDLQIESVLSLSSDEESDENDLTNRYRDSQSSVKTTIRIDEIESEKLSHSRDKSTSISSSVIQLDQHLTCRANLQESARDIRVQAPTTFPKRSLADIAAAGAGRKRYPFFANDWQQNDVTELSQSIFEEACVESFKDMASFKSQPAVQEKVFISREEKQHNLSSSSVIGVSLPTESIHELYASNQKERLSIAETLGDTGSERGEEDEANCEIVDISSFPAPPHSRSNSIPAIQVEMMDDGRLEQQQQSSGPQGLATNSVLLSPLTAPRTNAFALSRSTRGTGIEISKGYNNSSGVELASMVDKKQIMLSRKRTISNVPIYVTGLENLGDGAESDDNNVATFVFSNMY